MNVERPESDPVPTVKQETATSSPESVEVESDTPFDAPEMRSITASIDYDVRLELDDE